VCRFSLFSIPPFAAQRMRHPFHPRKQNLLVGAFGKLRQNKAACEFVRWPPMAYGDQNRRIATHKSLHLAVGAKVLILQKGNNEETAFTMRVTRFSRRISCRTTESTRYFH
jgi:hypothetical protein